MSIRLETRGDVQLVYRDDRLCSAIHRKNRQY
jgi:hypothetical protein